MALAAVAEHRDVLALDQGEVGVVVVEHLSHWGLSFWWVVRGRRGRSGYGRLSGRVSRLAGGDRDRHRAGGALGDRPAAAADGDHAGLDELADAERLDDPEEVGELVGVAGDLDRDGVGGDVDDLGAEQAGRRRAPGPGSSASALTLTSSELAVDRGGAVELDDLDHLDQLVELLGDLLERRLLDVDHDRHPRDVGVLGRADRQGVDVEAAPAEEPGDAGQDAGLVLDEDDRVCVLIECLASLRAPMSTGWLCSMVVSLRSPIRGRPRRTRARGRART